MAAIINEFGKGVVFTAPIDLGAKKPLDSRIVVNTLAERDAHITGNRCYIGMQVYVTATGLTYRYDGQDTQEAHIWSIVADRDWVLEQIQQGGISEARVREIFTEMFGTAKKQGLANDIRTYENTDAFPMLEKYIASTGVAKGDVVYYTRSGSAYPYTYTAADPQPVIGSDVTGYYELAVGHLYTAKWAESYTGDIPSDNVEYVDSLTQVEYIWRAINSAEFSGEYLMVNQTVDTGDIQDIFS